jgi:hypothetical protein
MFVKILPLIILTYHRWDSSLDDGDSTLNMQIFQCVDSLEKSKKGISMMYYYPSSHLTDLSSIYHRIVSCIHYFLIVGEN